MTFHSPTLALPKPWRTGWAFMAAFALQLLFALSFFVILALATVSAHADDLVCEGDNLVETLAKEQPELLAQIRAEAEKIPNGEGLLWRIEKPGATPSWLYGTMHVADPRVVEMTEAARAAYDGADTVVVEIKEVTNLEGAMASIMVDPSLTMLPDGKTIQDLLDEESLAQLETVLDERGLPMTFIARMKPWMIFSLISVPECELARRSRGEEFLDMRLAKGALEQGKTLKGLETLKEQLSILSGLPLDVQAVLLADTAALGSVLDDMTRTMTDLYLDENISMFMPLFKATAVNPDVSDDITGAYAKFEEDLIETRNHKMAERVQPILDDGNAFVAVGALHLPGEDGLVELLRNAGYTVTLVR